MLSHPINTYKPKYGLDWDPSVSDIQIDMILAKKWREEPYCFSNAMLEPGEHMLRAIRALFTPDQWTISPWTEEHAWAWTSFDFSVWLGAASTGKAQPHDELVQTPSGPRPIGSLVPGDYVIGLTGSPVKVKAVHEVGMKEEYRVTARDGRTALCAADHLWTVFQYSEAAGFDLYAGSTLLTLPANELIPGVHILPRCYFSLKTQPRCVTPPLNSPDALVSAEPTGRVVPMRCITVDSPDGLYLTGDFMPTHNSNDAGGLAVIDWLTDSTDTYIALASTSVPMLKMRSFESVTRYYRHLKRNAKISGLLIPGKESASQTAIVNSAEKGYDDELEDATHKASIRGVALSDGEESKAVARLAGAHLPYVTMILDEGTALPEAAAKARFNAAAGTLRFRFLSLANPVSKYDEATKFCEPIDGWDSVNENTPHWMSKYGLVLHHNGFNSPAIVEENGAKKYPFLINKSQIDKMVKECGGNADDPMIWRMVVGFPAPSNLEATVMSPADIATFDAQEQVVWRDGAPRYRVAGLDPAFTSGGDACVFQAAELGWSVTGVFTVQLLPKVRIPILASSDRPASYQVVDALRELMETYNIASVADVAVDDSGTQSVADIIEVELGSSPLRVNFSNKATLLPPGPDGKSPKARYKNIVTEIWHNVARVVRNGQLRGLSDEAAEQFCSRRFRKDITPLALEAKKEYKARVKGQKSPDDADAVGLCCHAAVIRGGLVLGRPLECARSDEWDLPVGATQLTSNVDDLMSSASAYIDDLMSGGRFDAYAGN